MTRVPAHEGPRKTQPDLCPIGERWCWDDDHAPSYCRHYCGTATLRRTPGPVTVLCSAPVKKGPAEAMETTKGPESK
jgi:hypothetical protein